MRQASWVQKTLQRYSTTIYACHFCGAQFVTDTWFAQHIWWEHGARDPVLRRFLGVDSERDNYHVANRSTSQAEGPSASL